MKYAVKLFEKIKKDILGKKYELSVALIAKKKSREINKKYRKQDKATNILSFALSKNAGEIILCPAVIRTEAKNLNRTYRQWQGYLVIHGMLHLEGMEHGSRMEIAQDFYFEKYDKKYFSGDRRGVVHHKGRGRRIREGREKS